MTSQYANTLMKQNRQKLTPVAIQAQKRYSWGGRWKDTLVATTAGYRGYCGRQNIFFKKNEETSPFKSWDFLEWCKKPAKDPSLNVTSKRPRYDRVHAQEFSRRTRKVLKSEPENYDTYWSVCWKAGICVRRKQRSELRIKVEFEFTTTRLQRKQVYGLLKKPLLSITMEWKPKSWSLSYFERKVSMNQTDGAIAVQILKNDETPTPYFGCQDNTNRMTYLKVAW